MLPILLLILGTEAQSSRTPFSRKFIKTIDEPFNQMVPPNEASLSYPGVSPSPIQNDQRILAEQTLYRPSKVTWPSKRGALYTVMLIDVSIQNNNSVMQWAVANIEGNNIAGGDEFMEYVTPVAWRNCHKNRDNHGGKCSGEGMIYDPDYVHRNVLFVFKQKKGQIRLEKGERNTGCQMNLQSTVSDAGTWHINNVTSFINKYNLELHAGTWFSMPYSPMVGAVLCQYHVCYGNLLSAFLNPNFFDPSDSSTIISLPGITDLPKCGPAKTYRNTSSHPLSLDNGTRDALDWSNLEESDFVCGQCIKDSGRDRLFKHQHKFSRNRPQTCIEFCHGSGYKYAGVQFGNQCFCGNTLPPASRITDSTECNMKCPGDKRYMCGGFDRMNVY